MSSGSRRSSLDGADLSSDSHCVKAKHATLSTAREPCSVCGEETAVGSVFFSDRRTIDRADGTVDYLCSLCDARLAAAHHQERMSDKQVRRFADTLSAVANQITNHRG